ncbi:MAG: hypothetical protein F4X26_11220, partial [Chloroflexi bacterium]|nr:hypothetical protein [Chloroflexota bacterium]
MAVASRARSLAAAAALLVAGAGMQAGTTGATAPSSPAIRAVVPGDRFLAVSWDAPAESGGQPVTAYDVRYGQQGSGAWTVVDGATSARRYTIRELANDSYYDVQVRAVNAIGESEWGESGSGKPRAVNSVPEFLAGETGARSVEENTPAGTDFGDPVAATDADDDAITYAISGAGARFFDVNPETGQLRTKEPLDHEARVSYALTVTATDVANARATQRVTVTVADVNEPPVITGPDSLEYAEGGTTPLAAYRFRDPEGDDVTFSLEGDGHFVMSITDGILGFVEPPDYENPGDGDRDNTYEVTVVADDGLNRGTHDVTVTVTNVNDPPVFSGDQAYTLRESDVVDEFVGTLTIRDQDDSYSAVSLAGPDRDAFVLRINSGTLASLFLRFAPDYEAPRDANRDNVYQVTVRASDASSTVSLPVTVTVENVDEAATVTFSTVQPQVGVPITATLHEPDRASGLSWRWQADGTPIDGATSSSYTPVGADIGALLAVTVSYTDGSGVAETASTTAYAEVRAAPATNAPPAFPAYETAARGVPENDFFLTRIRPPVAATDPDDDPLTYSLDRAAARYFDIEQSTGLLIARERLDREHRSSYRVIVTATDPSNARAAIAVTVSVLDEIEPPVLTGPLVVFYPSGGTRAVATYRAFDPENEEVTLGLRGTDSFRFTLDGGVLRFDDGPPDFANPGDSDDDNEYHLTIRATDPTLSEEMDVVVIVVDNAVRAPGAGGCVVYTSDAADDLTRV